MDRPILFSAPMVRAILDGSKTQTRRIIKGGPWASVFRDSMTDHTGSPEYLAERQDDTGRFLRCPYGAEGDRLWVRETWAPHDQGVISYKDRSGIYYRADDSRRYDTDGTWRPSIFMPRWASRITLDVVSVRVERLNDISEEDAKAEGAEIVNGHPELGALIGDGPSRREGFAQLWRSINGPGSWEASPWVWVVSFKRAEASR